MKADRLRLKAEVESLGDTAELLRQSGDAALVKRGRYRWLAMLCPCGCGDQLRINLDIGAGPAWNIYFFKRSLTIYPSVWRETKCQSHFIIWRSHILWFETPTEFEGGVLRSAVSSCLSGRLTSNEEIAEKVNSDPWTVMFICRQLVENGYAEEGIGRSRGTFRKRERT